MHVAVIPRDIIIIVMLDHYAAPGHVAHFEDVYI